MKYRRLGKTNLRVSVVGLGTWQFGGEWGKDFTQPDVNAILARARDLGINLIDTAECYGDHTSEAFIGSAIAHQRDHWLIATKFGHKFHAHLDRTDERSPADAVKQLEESLKALKTDYVDLLQYHSVRDSEFDNPELQETLKRLVRQGKVRHIGNSISSNDNLHQTQASTAAGVQAIQVVYNRLNRTPEQRVLPSCIAQDLGVLARVPLASGYLSGKYHPGATFPETDVRHGHARDHIDQTLRQVEQIRQTEVPPNVPMPTWALAWCLQHPALTAVIPGCKDPTQVDSNARAADLPTVTDDHRLAWNPA